jgi:hypothetical protein
MRRRKQPSAWARVKASQPIGFTPGADGVAARKLALSTHIRQVRERIFLLRRTCQACSGTRWRDCCGLPDQMHEDPPRSETRGLPPAQRFNEHICARLCAACHKDVHAGKLRLVKVTAQGFAGPVRAERIDTGRAV